MTLARRIREASEEASRIDVAIAGLLAEDGTYACLLTVPGIGPRTASELVVAIRIEDFPDHDHLASYCGIAPKNRRSGTSISSVRASRQGNKRLKNLLIFSCNSLVRSNNRFGEYCRVSVNIFFTISTNIFSPIAPPLFRRPRQRGCAASG